MEQERRKYMSFRLMKISRQAWNDAKKKVGKEVLSNMQYHIVITIFETPGISQDGVAKSLFMDKSSVAKLVARLVKDDYVKREINPDDRREYRLYLTDKGQEIIAELANALKEWEDRIFGEIGSDSYQSLDERLNTIEKQIF